MPPPPDEPLTPDEAGVLRAALASLDAILEAADARLATGLTDPADVFPALCDDGPPWPWDRYRRPGFDPEKVRRALRAHIDRMAKGAAGPEPSTN